MAVPERLIFERAGDGEHWKLRTEGGDVEGHGFRFRFSTEEGGETEGHGRTGSGFSAEPVGEEDGEPVYKLDFGADDVEGHAPGMDADSLKGDRIVLERAGDGERWRMRTGERPDAEGHAFRFKFSAEPMAEEEGGALQPPRFGDDDVEGHRYRYSDARLKRAIRPL